MVGTQGIEVYVARYRNHNTRYPEYAVPMESPKYNGNPREVYIEALTDDRFVIIVDLTESFDPKGCPALQIKLAVDALKPEAWMVHTASLEQMEAGARGVGRASLRGRYVHQTESRNLNGVVTRYGFAFGALTADGSIDLCSEEIANAVESYGKLMVTVQRGSMVKGKKSVARQHATDHESFDNVVDAAKDVVKDSFVSHNVKYTTT